MVQACTNCSVALPTLSAVLLERHAGVPAAVFVREPDWAPRSEDRHSMSATAAVYEHGG
jgi:hypothetical protein